MACTIDLKPEWRTLENKLTNIFQRYEEQKPPEEYTFAQFVFQKPTGLEQQCETLSLELQHIKHSIQKTKEKIKKAHDLCETLKTTSEKVKIHKIHNSITKKNMYIMENTLKINTIEQQLIILQEQIWQSLDFE